MLHSSILPGSTPPSLIAPHAPERYNTLVNSGIPDDLLATAVRPHLVAGRTYLVGYSGGADSAALLHVLHLLTQDIRARVIAVHLNHQLRGAASDADQATCAQFCNTLNVAFISARVDVAAFAREHHLSLEDAARRCRFRWFCEVARQQHASAIFLAHHADDQLETVFLRLLRGAGLRGLAGIRPVARFHDLTIIRPWLHIPHTLVRDYAARHHLPVCHDRSNTDQSFDRNWLRHDIIPRLTTRYPDLAARILTSATIARDADDFLTSRAEELVRHFVTHSFLGLLFPLDAFTALHTALQRAVLHYLLSALSGEAPPPASFERIECLRQFAASPAQRIPEPLPRPLFAEKAYGHLLLGRTCPPVRPQPLPPHGRFPLDNAMTLVIEPVPHRSTPLSHNGEAWRDAVCGRPAEMTQYAALPPRAQLAIRPRLPGDRYTPVNGPPRKIKDLFSAARIPTALKLRIPLLLCGEHILWLPGWRIAAPFAVRDPAPVFRLSLLISQPKITTISSRNVLSS